MKQHVKILIEVVMRPEKYFWIQNAPGQFDAAEYLFNNHREEVSNKEANKIVEVLLRSGKYTKINQPAPATNKEL
jgi:hypothetical protein